MYWPAGVSIWKMFLLPRIQMLRAAAPAATIGMPCWSATFEAASVMSDP